MFFFSPYASTALRLRILTLGGTAQELIKICNDEQMNDSKFKQKVQTEEKIYTNS